MARLAWLLGLLGTLSFTDAALQEVHIGTSYGYKTKCVATRGPVRCPRHVSYVGKKPDTFQISQRNGKVCARRTDYDGDWSVHLKVFCQGRSSSGISGVKKLRIGSSLDNNVKCVEDPGVKCDENAKQLGRTGKYPDTFHIYSHGNQICARRTDSPQGWGIDLVLRCQRTGRVKSWSMGGKTKVSIGSSLDSHVKCVDAPRAVHCDSTAKELGRTGKYPDTFHIYHEGAKICARRTDAEAGWGLDLVLECTRSLSGEPGYSGDGGYSYGHRSEYHNYASDYHYGGYHSGSLYMPTEHSEHSYGSHYHSHYHGGHHYGGSYGQFGSAGMTRVSIGSSLDSHVKCVDAPRAVHCDSTAKQLGRTGKYPDTFHIYHEGARICARRTDAEAGWGLDLELECRRTGATGGPGGAAGGYKGTVHHRYHSASYKQRKKRVEIGSSEQYIKCVPDPGHVHCDNTASQVGRTGEFPDTFHIYHQGTQICARRTDAQAAWGIHLVLDCDLYYKKHYGTSGYASPGTAFQLGSSPQSALKCVEDPGHLHCDDSAEEVGRTGEFPDTFHIYHSNGKICAQRTDAHSGWGLNLVLNCRSNRAHDEGYHGYDAGQTDGYYITPKVKFCCAQHLFSAACPYDCDAGDGSAEVTWTSTKRDWCCRNRIMGCPGGRQAASMLDGGISGTIYDCAVADPLSSASQGSRDVQGVVTAARYDCTHGSKESWSQDKAQYCRLWLDVPKGFHFTECDGDPIGWTREKARWCQAVGLNEQHAPHKCSRGHPDTWSQQKFEFCCVIKGIGCRQEEPLQMVLPEALKDANRNDWEEDASEDALDEAPSYPRPMEGDFALELHFDCVAQDEEDMLEWSATRQRWCCQKWGLGCKAIGHFNCSAGLWNWQRGWSRQKKNYCCQHEEKGCDGTAHDCTQDTHDLSPDGKKWCCENHMYSNGCPFNCQHGLKLWKIGFSTAKKSWCCKYEQLACPEVVTHHVTHHATHHAAHHVTHHATHHAAHYETHHVTHHVGAHESHHWFKFAGADAGERPGFSACRNIADRPQGLVDWCCSELALCHLSVQFDCQVGVNRWTEWSSEKKHHCCGREVHCGHSVTHSFHHHHVHHSSHAHHTQQLGHAELDDPQAWFNKKNVMNLHVGQSPDAGHKCVTPSEPVSCPMDAGNVRDDDYPDRFRVYRKGGQVCAQRTDYDKLWGLDLVLKCIKLDDHHFEKVHIGSSLDGSKKCVPQRSPVTCDDAASQAGRVDPHPDTFHVYHAGNEICVQRTDADSHWGVDLVLYCRQGSWSSPYWRASRMRTLKGAFYDSDVPTTSWTDRKPLLITSALVLILLATLAMLMGKTYRQQRHWTLMEATEDRLDCMLHGRTPWLARPLGDLDTDAREAEMVMA